LLENSFKIHFLYIGYNAAGAAVIYHDCTLKQGKNFRCLFGLFAVAGIGIWRS
jgi:hypothetical protein